jgi:hypothetical protein
MTWRTVTVKQASTVNAVLTVSVSFYDENAASAPDPVYVHILMGAGD